MRHRHPPDEESGGQGPTPETAASSKIQPADQQITQPLQSTASTDTSAQVSEQSSDDFDEHEPSTAERFEAFNQANPVVYEVIVRLAREWIASTGRRQMAIATLVERARWELAFTTSDPDYKINNDFRAYYARLIMIREPDLKDLFELRRSAADGWIGRAA